MPRTATLDRPSRVANLVAAALAGWSDERLCALLRARPDLATRPPATMSALAERVVGQPSAVAAYERLDRSAQQVAEVLAMLPDPADVATVARLIAHGVTPEQLERTLAVLEAVALAFRAGDHVTVNPGLAGVVARTGLGPPMAALLHGAPPHELAEVCRRLGLTPPGDKAATVQAITAHVGHPVHARRLVGSGPAGTLELAERAAREHRCG